MLTLALIPSASVALVVTRSVTHGVANGISVSLGIVLGDLVFICLAILGLSVVAETMDWLFVTLKYIGASYLLWLGYSLLTSDPATKSTTEPTPEIAVERSNKKGSLAASFLAGLFLTLGDIKAIFFYASLFPTFVNLEALRVAEVMTIILVTIVTVGGVKTFYAITANNVASILKRDEFKKINLEKKTKTVAGGLMLGAGAYLIVKA